MTQVTTFRHCISSGNFSMYNGDHFALQCYNDDILITGTSEQEHLHNLEEVLKRLSEYEIQVKREKSTFFKDTVEYLGHQISAEGLHTTPKKVEVIQTAPAPKNIQGL